MSDENSEVVALLRELVGLFREDLELSKKTVERTKQRSERASSASKFQQYWWGRSDGKEERRST